MLLMYSSLCCVAGSTNSHPFPRPPLPPTSPSSAETRSTKTGLASTVADLVKEREVADAESRMNRELIVKIRDSLEASKRDADLERSRTDSMKVELEVSEGICGLLRFLFHWTDCSPCDDVILVIPVCLVREGYILC